ncbi:MAG: hypothetical protein P4L46_06185 [Fimbriimonas sp.]|nr:hypothetical protein [Fimbriimonas sp.]
MFARQNPDFDPSTILCVRPNDEVDLDGLVAGRPEAFLRHRALSFESAFESNSAAIVKRIAVDQVRPAIGRATGGAESIVSVPGQVRQPWEEGDVPHGVLHRHAYRSEIVGETRRFLVYTPPGY